MNVETTSCSYTFKEAESSLGIRTLTQRIKIQTNFFLWILYAAGGISGVGNDRIIMRTSPS